MNRKKSLLAVVLALIASFILWAVVPSGAQAVSSNDEEPIVKLTAEQLKQKAEQGFLTEDSEVEKVKKEKKEKALREGTGRERRNPKSVLKGTRKATQQDVDSGFAASLASTIYLCSDGANLRDVVSGNPVRTLWVDLGWEETVSSSGRPLAKPNTGNSIVVHNDQSRAVYWSASQWDNGTGTQTLYGWARWAYNQTSYNVIGPYGGQLYQKVVSTGYIDQGNPGNAWYNQQISGAGYRTGITYYFGTSDSIPEMDIYLWGSGSYANNNSHTEVWIEATNDAPCGHVSTFLY